MTGDGADTDPDALRKAAIASEDDGDLDAMDAAYQRAVDADPERATTWSSWGLSLSHFAQCFDRPDLHPRALNAHRRAVALDAEDPHIRTLYGQALHFADVAAGDLSLVRAALDEFDAAERLGPPTTWTTLFRAHCLHDLARWDEAAAAYGALPAESEEVNVGWRLFLAREQRAWCLLRAGRGDEAERAFLDGLDGWERVLAVDPDRAIALHLPWLLERACAELPSLQDRTTALLRALGRDVDQ